MSSSEELKLHTSITANSVQRLFGIPGSSSYRSHPGQADGDAPVQIFKSMKLKEVPPLQDIRFLKGSVYSYKNRKVITRWLRDVSAAFHLKATTLGLGVQLTDAYIIGQLSTLAVSRCQLAAIAALWIAAKFEEMDDSVMRLKDLVSVCDGAYTADDVLTMEEDILGAFRWRIPHTTVVNHLYLLLHMHSVIALPAALSKDRAVAAVDTAPKSVVVAATTVVTVDAASKRRVEQPVSLPPNSTFHESLPLLCSAARVSHTSTVELFELFGGDVLLARRIALTETPAQLRNPLRIFVSNAGSSSREGGASAVFAEQNEVVLLRSVNGLLLHMALDVLAPEVVTHVEFLRLPSHNVAVGVLALARCIVGEAVDETRCAISTILATLQLSGVQALAAADLLCDKYTEAIAQPSGIPPPVVEPPNDIRDRLKYVFSKV